MIPAAGYDLQQQSRQATKESSSKSEKLVFAEFLSLKLYSYHEGGIGLGVDTFRDQNNSVPSSIESQTIPAFDPFSTQI